MRPSASLCQSSRYRLLTLLLVSLLGILCAQTVCGSSLPFRSKFRDLLQDVQLKEGGSPLSRRYRIRSGCNGDVQITPASGRLAVHAISSRDKPDFGLLTIESSSNTEIRIQGVKAQKYLCFSRRGRVIARYSGHSKWCAFHLKEKDGTTMLQSVAEPTWYVGFNKRGLSKRGDSFPDTRASNRNNRNKDRDARGSGRVNGARRPGQRRRGNRRRHRHDGRRGAGGGGGGGGRRNRRRHDSSSSSSSSSVSSSSNSRSSRRDRAFRRRGRLHQQRSRQRQSLRNKYECFQFFDIRIDEDASDPRFQNEKQKKIFDPLKDSDLSKLVISTPDSR